MTKYGTQKPTYRPVLNHIPGERELVSKFTTPHNNGDILHNEDGPAVVWSNESVEFHVNGILHNPDGPAVVDRQKNFVRMEWFIHGVRHREDGPAIEHINHNGTKYLVYYQDGKMHNTDGPAVIHPSGTKLWYNRGVIDRLDGPAIINMTDNNVLGNQWFITNKDVTKLYRRWASKRKIEANEENFGIFRMEYKFLGGKI